MRQEATTHTARPWAGLAALLLLASCAVHGPETPFAREHRKRLLAPARGTPQGLSVQWFGVSTLLFRDGDDAILIDGFLSRPSLLQTMVGTMRPSSQAASEALGTERVGTISAIFVAHAHHDHALDAPAIAALHGATLYGSMSTLNVAHEQRMASRFPAVMLEHGGHYPTAGFDVQAFVTPHSSTIFPLDEIAAPLALPEHALAFRAGANFSFLVERNGLRILVVPSAELGPDDIEPAAYIVFLGIGGLGMKSARQICELWEAAVSQRQARQVILVHWDNFLYPPDPALRTFAPPLDNVPRTVTVLGKLAQTDGIALHFVTPYDAVGLSTPGRPAPACKRPAPRQCGAWAAAYDETAEPGIDADDPGRLNASY